MLFSTAFVTDCDRNCMVTANSGEKKIKETTRRVVLLNSYGYFIAQA